MIRTLLFHFLLLFIPLTISGQEEDNPIPTDIRYAVDSVLGSIPNSNDAGKVKAYEELYNLFYLHTRQNDSIHYYLDHWIREADRQENRESEGKGRLTKLMLHYNEFRLDHFEADYEATLAFFKKHKQWDNLASLADLWLPLLCSQGLYEREIQEARKFYDYAKTNDLTAVMGVALTYMGQSYHGTNDMELAESSYKEAIAMLKKTDNLVLLGYTYQLYTGMLQTQRRYEETLSLLAEWEKLNERINDPTSTLIFHYYIQSVETSLGLGDTEKALELIADAEVLPLREQPIMRCHLYEQKVNLYEATGEYQLALLTLDSLRMELEQISPASIARVAWHRARIAAAAGEYEQAIEAHEELAIMQDSIWKEENARQLNDLHTQFEVDRHILEKERNRNYALLALVGLVMALLALGSRIFYSRRLHAKNRLLFHQLEEKDRLLQLVIAPAAKADKEKTSSEEPQASDLLFARLDQLMQEKQLYTHPDISRKSVAAELSTNENYLHTAIKCKLNISFSGYINHLRLEYARKLLLRSASGSSIEEIGTASGFGSRTTFYRLFREQYGMSPSEFRQIAVEERVKCVGSI